MRVETIMSREVATLPADASVESAMNLMDARRIRHVPVLEDGRLIGMLSDRDLLETAGRPEARERSVRDVMHAPVKTLAPADQLVSASLELVLHGIGCLPVVSDGRLIGIVTDVDLLRAFARASREGLLAEDASGDVRSSMTAHVTTVDVGTPLGAVRRELQSIRTRHLPVVDSAGALVGVLSDRDLRRASGLGRSEDTPVSDIMSTAVVSISPDRPLAEAAALMAERKFGALPVVEDGRLVGILTSTDLLEQCMNALWKPDAFQAE